MNLKSGCILWPQLDGEIATYPSLKSDLSVEAIIVGGGITGAFAAYFLTRAGMATALVDRRNIGHGSTEASTGLLQYEIDQPLVELARLRGQDAAIRAYRACVSALDKMRRVVADLNDDCGLTTRPSLYLASNARDVPALREEHEARRSCGISVQFCDEADIRRRFSFSRPAALYSPGALEVDPYRLAHFLLRRAVKGGLQAFSRTQVDEYLPHAGGVLLTTDAGHRIRAKMALLAPGYEAPPFVDMSMVRLKSTYALASDPVDSFEGWHERCLIWETARPYFYARTTPDHRILIGGEDEDFADAAQRDALIQYKSGVLRRRFGELFPRIDFKPACSWAGTFAQTRDGLPLIGPCPRFPGMYVALGYGGNGITFSLLAAEIIRDLYTGHANPDAELFRLDR